MVARSQEHRRSGRQSLRHGSRNRVENCIEDFLNAATAEAWILRRYAINQVGLNHCPSTPGNKEGGISGNAATRRRLGARL
jgi:hypothetical protein